MQLSIGVRTSIVAGLCGFAGGFAGAVGAAPAGEVLQVGSTLQLFADDRLIERAEGAALRLHAPVPREVVFRFDAPWEGPQCGYATILQDEGQYRLYYRAGGDLGWEQVAVGFSDDGVRFERPKLNLIEFQGSKANNVIWKGPRKGYHEAHNFTPFLDTNPAAHRSQRYKAVTLTKKDDPAKGWDGKRVLMAFASPDGIHWKPLQKEPVITDGSFDSQNTAFWDPNLKKYVCYLREGRDGKRSVQRATSDDFLHWSRPAWLDFGDTPIEQFYTNGIVLYPREPRLYVGLPMRFVPERKVIGADRRKIDGTSDAVFMTSHDGLRFYRTFMEGWIRPGLDPANWGHAHGNSTPVWGMVQTGPAEMSVYWAEHYGEVPQIRRGTVRLDGFGSIRGPYEGGEAVTRPIAFAGDGLYLNYSTSAVGSVRVEIQDASGRALEGYSLNDADELYGDELDRRFTWKERGDVSGLAGSTVRLRFVVKDADVFAMRFGDAR